jgi:hypothetical protein
VRNWRTGCFAGLLAGWFLYFNWSSLRVHFAPDDMMNMAYYFRAGPWRLAAALITPWTGFYRPVGGLFYMTLFAGFGLNPAPYHAAILVLLGGSVWLTYRFARMLGCGELAAGLAALAMAYHPGLSNLYYNPAFVYDVLCLFFYLAAFVWYGRIRESGKALRAGGTAVFLVLFLCALQSKEMAVTLPAALLAYEWFYHYRVREARWVLGLAAALDAAFMCGKLFGAGALISQPGYGAVFSVGRLMEFQRVMLSDVFVNWHYAVWPIWVGLGAMACASVWWLGWQAKGAGSQSGVALRFCWVFSIVIAPLPIEFLKGRSAACLAIPAVGLAVFAAVATTELAKLAGRREVTAAIVVAAVCLWAHRIHYLKGWLAAPAMAQLGQTGWEMIGQFRALDPHVRAGSRVVFLHDPSSDLETASIAQLWFRERSVEIHLQRQNPLPPEELTKMDALFDFRNGKLVRVK